MYYFTIKTADRLPKYEELGYEADNYKLIRHSIEEDMEQIGLRSDAVWAFFPHPETARYFYELWLYKNKEPMQIILSGATCYIMNSEGKTINTVYV